MFNMFRVNRAFFVSSCSAALVATTSYRHTSCSTNPDEWPFDPKGLGRERVLGFMTGERPLSLAAVGMRKKNLYLVDVDVYSVGLCLDNMMIRSAKNWFKSSQNLTLVQKLLKSEADISTFTQPKIILSLRFVRNVSQQQVIHAFQDAFKNCSQQVIADFVAALKTAVGEKGMKVGDELHFSWLNGGGLVVSRLDQVIPILHNEDIETLLLDVYLNREKSITPDLLKCLEKHIDAIEQISNHAT